MPPIVSQEDDTTAVVVTPKRKNYLNWDDYFLGIAILSSKRSKDPDHAEGACIVDTHNRIVAIGYSGFPKGCPDTIFPWVNDSSDPKVPWLHSKQPYVCRATTNAILNKCSQDVDGCRLYVMEFPSSDCVKVMIQSGIQEVVILQPSNANRSSMPSAATTPTTNQTVSKPTMTDDEQASRIMLEMANIHVRYHQPAIPNVTLDFGGVDSSLQYPTENSCCNHPKSSIDRAFDEEEENAIQILQQEAQYNATSVEDNGCRKRYLSWDDYFMSVAFLTAQRSKDPNTQVGACIVDDDRRIIGLGYNGMPRGLSDDAMPWARDGSNPPVFNKYLYVTHAEVNAIMNKGSANVKGSTIYVALFPCENCAKMIIQAGIRRVVYLSDRYHNTDGCKASRIMLKCAKVELVQYTPSRRQLTVEYDGKMSLTEK
jgi:dCMP deaminase